MTQLPPAVRLFDAGYVNLISVVPPGAPLAPSSGLNAASLGKAPGMKRGSTWSGYDWVRYPTTRSDVEQWVQDGANIGLRGDHFPMLDIDLLDPDMAKLVMNLAEDYFGWSPCRVGKPPKALFVYRLSADEEPFGRIAATVQKGEKLVGQVEWLTKGRQAVVLGQHPSGNQYTWDTPLWQVPVGHLPSVTLGEATEFLKRLATALEESFPVVCTLQTGFPGAAVVAQEGLRAPSLEALRELVARIPNPESVRYPEMISMATAVKASWDEPDSLDVFLEWGRRWEAPEGGNEAFLRKTWDTLRAPFKHGWTSLLLKGRIQGANTATFDFQPVALPETSAPAPAPAPAPAAAATSMAYSDQSLAAFVAQEVGSSVRWIAAKKKWRVWEQGKWADDSVEQGPRRIGDALKLYAEGLPTTNGAGAAAKDLCSQGRRSSVTAFVTNLLAVSPRAFDQDDMLLNTPGGIINLETDTMGPHDPDKLCALQTAVAPNFEMPTPVWDRFLDEVTVNRPALKAYLQRVAGYLLTGKTTEQAVCFFYGVGGNGKGVWTTTFQEIMGDYAVTASENLIAASGRGAHEESLAELDKKRFVLIEEAPKGDWNEERLKLLTGGTRLSARFMYGDRFEFVPTFKAIILGNSLPALENADAAMRRRLQVSSWDFKVTPETRDGELQNKLRPEYPGILAWALRGTTLWRRDKLSPPQEVLGITADLFEAQNPMMEWVHSALREESGAEHTIHSLYLSWFAWSRARGLPKTSETEFKLEWRKVAAPGHKVTVEDQPGWSGLRIRDANPG